MLRQVIADLGGPTVELDPDLWLDLARRVEAAAAQAPPPPAFPMVASQVLSIASKPDFDVNQLVGVVQRDAALATALLRFANSVAFSPAQAVTTVRDAIGRLGLQHVVEIVIGTCGRSFYNVATRAELELFPSLWQTMFDEAMANAFSAGRLALEVPGARSERSLLAGLLADIGRPLALRVLSALILGTGGGERIQRPDDAIALATVDEVAPALGKRVVAAMGLPEELRTACIGDRAGANPDAQIARLIAAIGAIQRRSPRLWASAGEAREAAERLGLGPLVVRALFAQRTQDVLAATEMFAQHART
jgi:HD-like signal output (HDOD) protein